MARPWLCVERKALHHALCYPKFLHNPILASETIFFNNIAIGAMNRTKLFYDPHTVKVILKTASGYFRILIVAKYVLQCQNKSTGVITSMTVLRVYPKRQIRTWLIQA